MGSGSHLLIANKNKRKTIGVEIDEQYFEIAKNTLQQDK